MKELSIEQKAKAYDRATEKIKYAVEHGVSPTLNKEDLQDLFPELFESKDEKIRKALIGTLNCDAAEKCLNSYGINKFAALAWLEKQVKKSEISLHENKTCKENDDSLTCKDKNILKAIIYTVKNSGYNYCIDVSNDEMITWIEKRKDYVSPQMVADAYLRGCNDTEKKWLEKQGQSFPILSNSTKTGKKWTEEDEDNFRDIISAIHSVAYRTTEDEEASIEWLKSLKQRVGEQ